MQMLVEIPYLVVQVLLYTNIVFWMLGYVVTASHYFWFLFAMLAALTGWTFFGLACVAVLPFQQLAQVIASATVVPLWNLFCGAWCIPQCT